MKQKKLGGRSGPPVQTLTCPNLYQKTFDRQESFPSVEIQQKTRSRPERGTKKSHSYRPLKAQASRDGFDYRLITREGDFAIYEQRWQDSENVCYEVIRIQRHEGYEIAGQFIEPAEIFPSSQRWGVDGWTVQTKDAAFEKFRQISAGRTGTTPNLETVGRQTGSQTNSNKTQTK